MKAFAFLVGVSLGCAVYDAWAAALGTLALAYLVRACGSRRGRP